MEDNKKSKSFPMKLGVVLGLVVFVITICIILVSGIRIGNKNDVKEPVKKQDEVVLVDKNKDLTNEGNQNKEPKKDGEVPKKDNLEKPTNSGKADKSDDSKKEEKADEKVQSDKVGKKENNLVKIDNQELNQEEKEVSVVVSGKDIYKVDNSVYTYALNLIFPSGDDYNVIKYFCSKKAYDAIEEGSTIKATYQVDKDGVISIKTVTK